MWDSTCCADAASGKTIVARMAIPSIRDFVIFIRLIVFTLECEVKTQQQAAGGQIQSVNGRSASLPQDGVFAVVGKAGAAGNKGVVPQAECQHVFVAKGLGVGGENLARHADQLVPVDQDKLRVQVVVSLKEAAAPGRRPGAARKQLIGWGIRTQESTIPSMEEHGGHVELVEVPHADQAIAVETLVSDSRSSHRVRRCAADCNSIGVCADRARDGLRELKERRGLTDVGKRSYSLQAQAAKLKRAASGKKSIVAAARDRTRLPIFRAEYRSRDAGAVIFRMPHPL